MKLKHYPSSAFVSEETFHRLMAGLPLDSNFAGDIRMLRSFRRDLRPTLCRVLNLPLARRAEASTQRLLADFGLSPGER